MSNHTRNGAGSPKNSWIRCAPLRIPLKRRAQTCAVLCALFIAPCVGSVLIALAVWPPGRILLGIYVAWLLLLDWRTPVRGGRVIHWIRRLYLWRLIADYFPARLIVEGAFTAGKPHLFALHPHGIISISTLCNLLWDVNAPSRQLGLEYRVATVRANFMPPLWRDLLMAMGFVDASPASLRWLLQHGLSVMLVVGGARETLEAQPGAADLVLTRRRGFVRLALEHGACLVPVYHFGENELFVQARSPLLRWLQEKAIHYFGFTVPLLRGRGIFQYDWGILPRRVQLTTVVGKPLDMPHIPSPTHEDIATHHARYCAALEALYNAHKDELQHPTDFFGNPLPAQPLRIVA